MPEFNFFKKYKKLIIPTFLFFGSFAISFYRALDLQHGEDFRHSLAVLKFIRYPSITPVMAQNINGMEFYLIPFYFLFGFNLFSMRLAQSLLLGSAVVLFYLFSKDHFKDKNKAMAATVFLALFPNFILMKYQEYPFVIFIGVLSLFLLSRIRKKEKNLKYIILFGLTFGIGTYHKILTGAFIFCLLFSYTLILWKEAKEKLLHFKELSFLALFSLIGVSPLLLWNIIFEGATFKHFFRSASETSLNIMPAIVERISQLRDLFAVSPLRYYGQIEAVGLFFFILLIFSVIYLAFKGDKENSVYAFAATLYFLLATFQLNHLIPEHLSVLIPLLVLIIFSGTSLLIEDLFGKSNYKSKVIYSFFTLLIFLSFFNLFRILYTDNEYGWFLKDYEIGYALRGDDVENIYLFQPDNYAFWNSIQFTSKQENTYLASHTMEGKDKVIHGYWDGGSVGGFKDGAVIKKSLDEVLKTSSSRKNAYLDTNLYFEREKEEDRRAVRDYMDRVLSENGYKRIDIEQKILRLEEGYRDELNKVYMVWIHESQKEIIDKLNQLKDD